MLGRTDRGRNDPSAEKGHPFTRVVVEKPIGPDLASASEINAELARHFDESQIFRIDHYLGKETVENLMVLRFANAIFEPIWTARFIDHVQITVAEQEGVGTRAAYYDHAGALRDMVQSHILQMLCMIATEPPSTTGAESCATPSSTCCARCARSATRTSRSASCAASTAKDSSAASRSRPIATRSTSRRIRKIETFVALRCCIENWRWAGVPFYLRTGKRLPKRSSEIAIYFNSVPRILYNANPRAPLAPNMLTIRIQPDEGLALNIISKVPGSQTLPAAGRRRFSLRDLDARSIRDPAQRRDRRRPDALHAARYGRRGVAFVQPILDAWEKSPMDPPIYAAGSWGPLEAALMIAADGRTWRTL